MAEFEIIKADLSLDAHKDILPSDKEEQFCGEYADRPGNEEYLFKVDGRPAGLAIIGGSREDKLPGENAEIQAFYFHPDFWGRGHSCKAMRFCLDRLKELGYASVYLWVLDKNKRARRFYEKFGFTFDGNRKTINNGGKNFIEVRYILEKGL
jgi:RimJ/RimL family protein N-acetyltransferase